MKKVLYFSFLGLVPMWLLAFNPPQHKTDYQVQYNLTEIVDKMIEVTVVVPIQNTETTIYNMPKMVPGTYKIYDFGKYVHNLKAFDKAGNELVVEKLNENQWQIKKARSLYKIQYWANGSFQERNSKVFAPAGSSITKDAFLLNNFGFVGYLDGMKDNPYSLQIKKPEALYGTTSLPTVSRTKSVDSYRAAHYFQLHDCPILYAAPDTASTIVAGMPVYIGVYSPKNTVSASQLRDELIPVFEATAKYLGDTLPASQYTIIVYGLSLAKAAAGSGALEHHTSTVLTMPDVDAKMIEMMTGEPAMKMYRDIVAHEFFHIVTPLNIHSLQINDFDFINPQMSEHLWLYEGVTEYNSMIAQTRGGVIDAEVFIEEVGSKLRQARSFDEHIPFTLMSKHALGYFENQYYNVYQQGAIIGMAVDLKLLTLSKGQYGLVNLLRDLWQSFGPDTFFVDDQLFSIMAKTSGYPELEEFLLRHVAGTRPLPLADLLLPFGVSYTESTFTESVTIGKMSVGLNQKNNTVTFNSYDVSSPFAQEFALQKDDVIKRWNGQEIRADNYREFITNYVNNAVAGEKCVIEVAREVKPGKQKTVKLTGKNVTSSEEVKDRIKFIENPTQAQLLMRKAWLGQ